MRAEGPKNFLQRPSNRKNCPLLICKEFLINNFTSLFWIKQQIKTFNNHTIFFRDQFGWQFSSFSPICFVDARIRTHYRSREALTFTNWPRHMKLFVKFLGAQLNQVNDEVPERSQLFCQYYFTHKIQMQTVRQEKQQKTLPNKKLLVKCK